MVMERDDHDSFIEVYDVPSAAFLDLSVRRSRLGFLVAYSQQLRKWMLYGPDRRLIDAADDVAVIRRRYLAETEALLAPC